MSNHTLDVRNLLCPLPVIRAQDTIAGLMPGDVLTVLCTDPGTRNDIPTWCRINQHDVLAIEETSTLMTFTIKVGHA